MIRLHWDEGPKGYTDLLPVDWFLKEGDFRNYMHIVEGPKTGKYEAKCNLLVSGTYADLDYDAFKRFNKSNGMLCGLMRLRFSDKTRAIVKNVSWQNERCAVTVEYQSREMSDAIAKAGAD